MSYIIVMNSFYILMGTFLTLEFLTIRINGINGVAGGTGLTLKIKIFLNWYILFNIGLENIVVFLLFIITET